MSQRTAACARNTCGHKTGTRPRHLPASSGGGLSGPLEALLKLKLEPMVAAALVAVASGVVSPPLGLPERCSLALTSGSVTIHVVYDRRSDRGPCWCQSRSRKTQIGHEALEMRR